MWAWDDFAVIEDKLGIQEDVLSFDRQLAA